MVIAAAILLAEYLLISLRFDAGSVRERGGAWAGVARIGAYAPLGVVVASGLWLLRGRHRSAGHTLGVQARTGLSREGLGWLLAHAGLATAFLALTNHLFGARDAPSGSPAAWLAAWAVLGAVSASSVFLAFVHIDLARLRVFAGVAALAACIGLAGWVAGRWTLELWSPLSRITLLLVAGMLQLMIEDVRSDASDLSIGIADFEVTVAPVCSGFEGMGLISVLLGAFLAVNRASLHFPRALLLLPLGVTAAFFGNALRIGGLLVVGAYLDPDLAHDSFHSKAGWILFCGIALGLCALAQRHPFFSRAAISTEIETENPTASYLLPFLLLLGIALLTGAFTRDVDWFYAVRLLPPMFALYRFRGAFEGLVQRPSWASVALGMAVGAGWLLTSPENADVTQRVADALAREPALLSALWICSRVVGSIVVIPICEELAFRGFLLRWLVSRDFTSVSWVAWTPLAVLGSSIAFGLIHERWLAGAVAGLVFAAIQVRSGRIADAIAAHGASNLVIAGWVLASSDWSHW